MPSIGDPSPLSGGGFSFRGWRVVGLRASVRLSTDRGRARQESSCGSPFPPFRRLPLSGGGAAAPTFFVGAGAAACGHSWSACCPRYACGCAGVRGGDWAPLTVLLLLAELQPLTSASGEPRRASPGARLSGRTPTPLPTTSDQTRQPAEFKHITKRRKRN